MGKGSASHYELSLKSKSICAKKHIQTPDADTVLPHWTRSGCLNKVPLKNETNSCFNFAMISHSSSPLLLLLKIIFMTGQSVFNYSVHGVQQWVCNPLALLLLFANISNFTLVKFSCKSPFKREASRERYVISNLWFPLSLWGLGFVMGCVLGFEVKMGCWLGPEANCQKLCYLTHFCKVAILWNNAMEVWELWSDPNYWMSPPFV